MDLFLFVQGAKVSTILSKVALTWKEECLFYSIMLPFKSMSPVHRSFGTWNHICISHIFMHESKSNMIHTLFFLCIFTFIVLNVRGYIIPRSKCSNSFQENVVRRIGMTSIAFSAFIITIEPSFGMDDYFMLREQARDPLKAKAMKELRDLRTLQDARLDACVGEFES